MDYQTLATLIFARTPKKSKTSFTKNAIITGFELVNSINAVDPMIFDNEDVRNFAVGKIKPEDEWFAKKSYQLASAIIQGKVSAPVEKKKPKSSKRRGKKKSVNLK